MSQRPKHALSSRRGGRACGLSEKNTFGATHNTISGEAKSYQAQCGTWWWRALAVPFSQEELPKRREGQCGADSEPCLGSMSVPHRSNPTRVLQAGSMESARSCPSSSRVWPSSTSGAHRIWTRAGFGGPDPIRRNGGIRKTEHRANPSSERPFSGDPRHRRPIQAPRATPPAGIGPCFVEFGPTSAQHRSPDLADVGPCLADFPSALPNTRPSPRVRLGPNGLKLLQTWAKDRHKLGGGRATFRPDFERVRPRSARVRPRFGRIGRSSTCGPKSCAAIVPAHDLNNVEYSVLDMFQNGKNERHMGAYPIYTYFSNFCASFWMQSRRSR